MFFCNALVISNRCMSSRAGHASGRKRATATHCSDELLPHGRKLPTHGRQQPTHSANEAWQPQDGRCTPLDLGDDLWGARPADDLHHEISKRRGQAYDNRRLIRWICCGNCCCPCAPVVANGRPTVSNTRSSRTVANGRPTVAHSLPPFVLVFLSFSIPRAIVAVVIVVLLSLCARPLSWPHRGAALRAAAPPLLSAVASGHPTWSTSRDIKQWQGLPRL